MKHIYKAFGFIELEDNCGGDHYYVFVASTLLAALVIGGVNLLFFISLNITIFPFYFLWFFPALVLLLLLITLRNPRKYVVHCFTLFLSTTTIGWLCSIFLLYTAVVIFPSLVVWSVSIFLFLYNVILLVSMRCNYSRSKRKIKKKYANKKVNSIPLLEGPVWSEGSLITKTLFLICLQSITAPFLYFYTKLHQSDYFLGACVVFYLVLMVNCIMSWINLKAFYTFHVAYLTSKELYQESLTAK